MFYSKNSRTIARTDTAIQQVTKMIFAKG